MLDQFAVGDPETMRLADVEPRPIALNAKKFAPKCPHPAHAGRHERALGEQFLAPVGLIRNSCKHVHQNFLEVLQPVPQRRRRWMIDHIGMDKSFKRSVVQIRKGRNQRRTRSLLNSC
jgi:hypothetical protein